MPALSFPDLLPSIEDPLLLPSSRNPPNPYPRPSPFRPPRSPPDSVYTHAYGTDTNTYHDAVLPPHLTASSSSSAAFSHLSLSQAFSNWQPHIHYLHHNPYPPPQPSQLIHKVWILDCRSCGTFLTNRGMKAVLLLRPNVSLFSTDALPVNCSAYSTDQDALHPPLCRSIPTFPPRTCECLTQTLCCHTCGTAVGYMIVIPCFRCTSSISATNRATNGHRFVFHSSEITASERHHILDEPGVLAIEYPSPPPPPSSPPPLAPAYPAILHPTDPATYRRSGISVPSQPFTTSSPSPRSESLPSPQMGSPVLDPWSPVSSPDLNTSAPPISPRQSPRPPLQAPLPRDPVLHTLPETRGTTPELYPRKLKPGEVLYWHHLTRHGEIPGVEEDPRARVPTRRDSLLLFER